MFRTFLNNLLIYFQLFVSLWTDREESVCCIIFMLSQALSIKTQREELVLFGALHSHTDYETGHVVTFSVREEEYLAICSAKIKFRGDLRGAGNRWSHWMNF